MYIDNFKVRLGFFEKNQNLYFSNIGMIYAKRKRIVKAALKLWREILIISCLYIKR